MHYWLMLYLAPTLDELSNTRSVFQIGVKLKPLAVAIATLKKQRIAAWFLPIVRKLN